MDLDSVFLRARRSLREDLRLYLVAVSSLAVAFLCLGLTLVAMRNVTRMAERWSGAGLMTVYLRDGAAASDIESLKAALGEVRDVESVAHLTSDAARTQFLSDLHGGEELDGIPVDAFPASLELNLRENVPAERVEQIAAQLERFSAVEDVEAYRGWFTKMQSMLSAGRGVAIGLGLLVLLCVLAVVGNTIRLAVAQRREEIEILKLCGATDGFVRGPFVLEGAAQGLAAALAAVLLLGIGYVALRVQFDSTLAEITGTRILFLHPMVVAALIAGGAIAGAIGSAFSLRRYLLV